MKSLFKSNGKDFFSVGGQVNNSSSANPPIMQLAFQTVNKLGLNTIAAPVHWELFEPSEGQYSFDQIEMLIEGARESKLKLVVLWFGTWKNGNSHYVPKWIKLEKERFLWSKAADGTEVRSLSPICKETLEADKRAFATLCKYIAENNEDETVIGIQIENEPGIIGSPRDYSPESTKHFEEDVPDEVSKFMGKTGNWEEVFGIDGAEFFTAYHIAKYIDSIAVTGKKLIDLPLYINVWLGEMYSRIPGISYPSGGAVSRTFKFWKNFAPHVDAIAPDIYVCDFSTTEELYKTYSSEENIFYIPESMPNPLSMINSMRAIAEYGLTGIHVFGVDMLAAAQGPMLEEMKKSASPDMLRLLSSVKETIDSLKIIMNFKPLIEEFQGTGKLFAVGQYESLAEQYIDFGDYIGTVRFLNNHGEVFHKNTDTNMDNRHFSELYPNYRGKGFIVYKGNGEFFLAGDAYRLMLYPKKDIVELTSVIHAGDFLNQRSQGYVTVTEGYFAPDGTYMPTIMRNGDEYDYGLWVTADIGVLHVQMDR